MYLRCFAIKIENFYSSNLVVNPQTKLFIIQTCDPFSGL